MRVDMTSSELAEFISSAPKSTPSVFFLKLNKQLEFPRCDVFGAGSCIVFGDFEGIRKILDDNPEAVVGERHFCFARGSGVPLSGAESFDARIEPGAIVRDRVKIGKKAVIMMGAVVNIGAEIGEKTMIDMNAVVGARAQIGKNCHIGAGAVVAGVIEPPSAIPVVVGDNVTVGAKRRSARGRAYRRRGSGRGGSGGYAGRALRLRGGGLPCKNFKARRRKNPRKDQNGGKSEGMKMKKTKITAAVVGATGLVGRAFCKVWKSRAFCPKGCFCSLRKKARALNWNSTEKSTP